MTVLGTALFVEELPPLSTTRRSAKHLDNAQGGQVDARRGDASVGYAVASPPPSALPP
jgi:hypothetical protein